MKKFLLLVALSFIMGFGLLCGCDTGYTPEAEHYFKTGEVYRVLELADETPEHRKDFGFESYIMPSNGNTVGAGVRLSVDSSFAENSLLFDRYAMLNRQGVETVYDYLGIEPIEVTDECFMCSYTGFYSFNSKIEYATTTNFEIDLGEYAPYELLGSIADVDIYTFNYTDLSVKDGSEVKSGSFKVIIITGNVYVGKFSLEEI